MAIVKLGSIVSGISGSLGQTTFANRRTGLIAAKRCLKINRRTTSQLESRATLRAVQHAWAGLSNQQRTEWKIAAQQSKLTNRLGTTITLSAYQYFCKVNLFSYGLYFWIYESPPQMAQPISCTEASATIDHASPAQYLYTNCEADPPYGGELYGTRTFRSGSNIPRARYITKRVGNLPFIYGPNCVILYWNKVMGTPIEGEIVGISFRLCTITVLTDPVRIMPSWPPAPLFTFWATCI